ncbi:type 1 glutamine amidotransferase domain-containing protein [Mycobacterium hodleri]|uniref:type 1 glutamine amidotransferase domain-containing protein n=1 Tax=Mycolicibacterium hodleri TaxID=49897 RepID=UPI0021F281E8|nr:type 1 glutamine amidotransferase domain-containing protein [Mycolicibacterium hodleri]MCV7133443.1 type 1 glutamine amidotransferase domain-containing protein [Mycolicibacterium hodleri]
MKALFVSSSHETGTWLSEVTHPYWHLIERGIDVDFSSPDGGRVNWSAMSDPYSEQSQEADDLVSKGFLSDTALVERLTSTLKLAHVDLEQYDIIHFTGGQGATYDFFPNPDVTAALEHFFANDKVVAVICHGAIALGNVPDRLRGRRVTGYSRAEDAVLEEYGFTFPHFPQTVLEEAGGRYTSAGLAEPCVVVDGRLITGQNQQSASEYGIALLHLVAGRSPVAVG